MNRLYQMNQKEYQGLLQVASEQVPFGIYAIEKHAVYYYYLQQRPEAVASINEVTDNQKLLADTNQM